MILAGLSAPATKPARDRIGIGRPEPNGERLPAAVARAVEELDWIAAVAGGEGKVVATSFDGTQIDVRLLPPGSYGNLLQHFTGSKEHNVALREAAVRAGLKVSEFGIEDVESGEVFRTDDEPEVYARLGMEWIPPELRENRGEIALARDGALPELVELDDIRGDLHSHTDWTDGKASLETTARRSGSGWASTRAA